jgi:hypothetical protein
MTVAKLRTLKQLCVTGNTPPAHIRQFRRPLAEILLFASGLTPTGGLSTPYCGHMQPVSWDLCSCWSISHEPSTVFDAKSSVVFGYLGFDLTVYLFGIEPGTSFANQP